MVSQASDFAILSKRLDRIERRDRTLAVVALLLVSGGAIGILLGQPANDVTVRAQEFILQDPNGRLLARLAYQAQDGALMPTLQFFDATGNERISLGLPNSQGLPELSLIAPTGSPRTFLSLSDLHMGSWSSGPGPFSFFVHVTPDEGGSMGLDNSFNPTRSILSLGRDGGSIILRRKDGQVILGDSGGFYSKNPEATAPPVSIVLVGENQKTLWQAP